MTGYWAAWPRSTTSSGEGACQKMMRLYLKQQRLVCDWADWIKWGVVAGGPLSWMRHSAVTGCYTGSLSRRSAFLLRKRWYLYPHLRLSVRFDGLSWTEELLNHCLGLLRLFFHADFYFFSCFWFIFFRKREARRLFLTMKVNLQFYYIPVCKPTTPASAVKVSQPLPCMCVRVYSLPEITWQTTSAPHRVKWLQIIRIINSTSVHNPQLDSVITPVSQYSFCQKSLTLWNKCYFDSLVSTKLFYQRRGTDSRERPLAWHSLRRCEENQAQSGKSASRTKE